eukprot:snap_masked-scaffold_1-processed-gene-24.56-mRNA-1 protein AED:1.00 eAED:1.00 QI:0/0/0/0/1/1/2/0/420
MMKKEFEKRWKDAEKESEKLYELQYNKTSSFPAFTMADLRAHPKFEALNRFVYHSWKDLEKYPQDYPQWLYLHLGRITGSNVLGCLGILEPTYSWFMRIPKGVRGHKKTLDVFESLTKFTQPLTFNEMFENLYAHTVNAVDYFDFRKNSEAKARITWERSGTDRAQCFTSNKRFNFGEIESLTHNRSIDEIRLGWGKLMEPTAILAAINFMSKISKQHFSCHEVGMYTSEALLASKKISKVSGIQRKQLILLQQLHSYGGRLGASPDALFKFDDGTTEVVEVKNKCPFYFRKLSIQKNVPDDRFIDDCVPVWYMPQIQLEIFCAGFQCKKALFLRLYERAGAKVFRVRRNDLLILTMLEQLVSFYKKYVIPGVRPSRDWSYKQKLVRKLESKLKSMRDPSRKHIYDLDIKIDEAKLQRLS